MSLKLIVILIIGSLLHIQFLGLDEILKVPDSFAYLQMSHFLGELDTRGLGNGWFGFLYSLPIAFVELFTSNSFLAGKIVNIVLVNTSAILLYQISRLLLSEKFSLGVIALFFLSPILLHFNIHILSENIYIPLFLFLILQLISYIQRPHAQQTLLIAGILGCMYLTRAEAFIYIISIFLIALLLLSQKKLSPKKFMNYGAVFLLGFFIFISPYLFHLHTLTGEWGLTNKGASNLRQAELRGTEKMDDAGFEQAVGELTPDKHHLIAGFAGGMNYDTPQIEKTLGSSISESPGGFFSRVLTNQKKLFTQNLPEIFLGKAPSLFFSDDSRFSGNWLFLLFTIVPLFILLYGVYRLYKNQRSFLILCLSFFLPATIFFTIFFTLNRYFLIFLPLMLLVFMYGIQEIHASLCGKPWFRFVPILCFFHLVSILVFSTLVYYNTEKDKDTYYELKQEAGGWLKENYTGNLAIMERFPIVTYYSGSKQRWITPYEPENENLLEYARYNNIEILVVDTMDFLTYRPFLSNYLEQTPKGMELLKSFSNTEGQKVILYHIKK